MHYQQRYFIPPERSYFLFGPRGTGKSTWLKHIYTQNVLWLDLLDPKLERELRAKPERLLELMRAQLELDRVVIDEVQRVPELLPLVHQCIENNPQICFVLTGSSSRKLKRVGTDLLAGRAVRRHFHPFMLSELEPCPSLETTLVQGLLPLVLDSQNPGDHLKSYVSMTMKEEVLAEGLVRNVAVFSRFLEQISFSHGEVLSLAEIARSCHVDRKTVESYLSILEDLLLAVRIPVFTKRAKRQLVAHPKLYFFDVGIFLSIRPSGPLDEPQNILGPSLEGLVLQHLLAWNDHSGHAHEISYWRTRNGNEVDFIVYGEQQFVAIEVKNTEVIRGKDLSGLNAFKTDFPMVEGLLLYRGNESFVRDGIWCYPVEIYLKNLKPKMALHPSQWPSVKTS
jgi:uncharacterized protein